MSRPGMIIVGVLVFAIAIALFTSPRPKTTVRTGTPEQKTESAGQPPAAAAQPAAPAPAQPPAPTPLPAPPTALAGAGPDFDLLRDRFGRPDPFEPLHPPAAPAEASVSGLPPLPGAGALPPLQFNAADQFQLSAIAMSGNTGIAVVNGELYRAGDMIRQYTIEKITPDAVLMKSDVGERLTLRIQQAPATGYIVTPGSISNIIEPVAPGAGLPAPAPQPGAMKIFDSGL